MACGRDASVFHAACSLRKPARCVITMEHVRGDVPRVWDRAVTCVRSVLPHLCHGGRAGCPLASGTVTGHCATASAAPGTRRSDLRPPETVLPRAPLTPHAEQCLHGSAHRQPKTLQRSVEVGFSGDEAKRVPSQWHWHSLRSC